ncbi:MAG: PHP domain-containing protein, partial [Pseudomonadota bacterium]
MSYAELSATTNFTFLTGASHPEEMVTRAAELGLDAIAITDRNTLAGVVRAHIRLRELRREHVTRKDRNITGTDVREHAKIRSQTRIDPSSRKAYGPPPPSVSQVAPEPEPIRSLPKLLIGSRLSFTDSVIEITALVPDRKAYAELTRLLTLGKRRAEKGGCALTLDDFLQTQGFLALIHLPDPAAVKEAPISKPGGRAGVQDALRVTRRFKGQCWLAATPRWDGRDRARIATYATLAGQLSLDLVATNAPVLHRASRRRLADVLTCIRERCTMSKIGARALPNSELRLRADSDMLKLFAGHEDAVHRTAEIAARCRFSLDELSYEYPDEGQGERPQDRLTRLAKEGLAWRYPSGIPDRAQSLVNRELELIGKLNYAPYFLTVHDIVAFARSRGILCQGRGSAANSTVCYALGITEIA